MTNKSRTLRVSLSLMIVLGIVAQPVIACTGITLRAMDGSVVFARTMEWGTFDLRSNLVVVPRGLKFSSKIGEGLTGIEWESKYGAVGLDALNKNFLVDGMNERGLSVNVFYHPGFADYPELDPERQSGTIE